MGPAWRRKKTGVELGSASHSPLSSSEASRRGCAIRAMREIHPHDLWRFNSGITTRRSVLRRRASADEIKSAFRKLARKHHPDMAKPKEKVAAEERFKQINEAYEVLSDPEKRAQYDQLGRGLESAGRISTAAGLGPGRNGRRISAVMPAGTAAELSSNLAAPGSAISSRRFSAADAASRPSAAGFGRRPATAERGQDVEADIMVTLEEALNGSTRQVSLRRSDSEKVETYQVKIPRGRARRTTHPAGGAGRSRCARREKGDLFLRVRLARHPDFSVEGNDLVHEAAAFAVAGGARH